jgi:hypothetical protein
MQLILDAQMWCAGVVERLISFDPTPQVLFASNADPDGSINPILLTEMTRCFSLGF